MDARELAPDTDWEQVFVGHRRYLWAVCYRLTGSVNDAEDLVQGTFIRAMERPPIDRGRPWRPWLTKVATNMAIDLLRRRKHRAYDGPWLPAPIEEIEEVEGWGPPSGGEDMEWRYGQLESAQFAFLLALEILDAKGRAVLILRDVLGYTGPEVAEVLGLSASNVRVILHRARAALARHRDQADRAELCDESVLGVQTREALGRFMGAVVSGDAAALASLLTADVVALSDGGGEFTSARKPVRGAAKVAALYVGINRHLDGGPRWIEIREINGLPALVFAMPDRGGRYAPTGVLRIELAKDGRIREVHQILASGKLAGIDFSGPRGRVF